MPFKKDELSKYDFLSIIEFLFVLFFIVLFAFSSFLGIPATFKKFIPQYSWFLDSHYFMTLLYIIFLILIFYTIYFFCARRKDKTIQEALFLYPKSKKTILISILIGVIVPLATSPILIKCAPKDFYAMSLLKEEGGLFFGFSHFMNIGNAYILLSLFIFYGFVLTLVRYFTNSLIPPIITHFVHNVTLIVGFLVVAGFYQ